MLNFHLPPMRVPCLSRGSHPPSPPPRLRGSAREGAAGTSGRSPKYGWAGAATPTQRSMTRPSASTKNAGYGKSNGTPLAGKGNPTWPFSNALEEATPWRNDLLDPAARAVRQRAHAPVASRAVAVIAAAVREIRAGLADIPLRAGARLFLQDDEEALWHGWQITRSCGGLGRRYADPRFAALRGMPEGDSQLRSPAPAPDRDR
jgi:hypothetical protein